jgi:hypothetical protein
MNRDRSHLHVIAGARSAGKITFMFAKRGEPRHDLVPFSDLIFDTVISGSSFPEELERLLQACSSGCAGKRRRIVIN